MSESKTRANVAPPPRKQNMSFLPSSATAEAVQPADNMKDKREIMMSFNMPIEWHSRFKMTAASRGIKMRELLMECFDTWEKSQNSK